MSDGCCPQCRLLQRWSLRGRCRHCGDVAVLAVPADLDALLAPRVSVALVKTEPPKGVRDKLALVTTGLGIPIVGALGMIAVSHPAGMLAAAVFAIGAYNLQFWRAKVKKKPRLPPVSMPTKPAAEGRVELVGIAEPFGRALDAPISGSPTVAAAVVVEDWAHDLLVRAVVATQFWLVVDDSRRVLVTGECWVAHGTRTVAREAWKKYVERLGGAAIPLPTPYAIIEHAIAPRARIRVSGVLREEHVAGESFRETTAETLRGEAGNVVWIEQLDA